MTYVLISMVVVAEVTEKEKVIYLVRCCPKVPDRNKLNQLVNQQPIVFVEHPPTQLGKPVRIIKGVEEPFAIALNKNGTRMV